jgi:cytochrome P450
MLMEIFKRLEDRPKLLQVLATAGEQGLIRSLVQMDPPDHTDYRALVQPWFKPSNIKALEDRLNVITETIFDDMMGDGGERELDFVQDVAVWPPLKLIVELLGVPEEDEPLILKLTNELFAGEHFRVLLDFDDVRVLGYCPERPKLLGIHHPQWVILPQPGKGRMRVAALAVDLW